MARKRTIFWFALNVFKDFPKILRDLETAGKESWRAMTVTEEYGRDGLRYREVPLIPHLLFVRCTAGWLEEYKRQNNDYCMFYRDLATGKPGPVDDREMEVFRTVTSIRDGNVRFLGEDKPEYHKGDHVRVIGGLYKGAEGYVKRIERSRDLLVCISGVAVIAISHIHPQYLEKIEQP